MSGYHSALVVYAILLGVECQKPGESESYVYVEKNSID